MKNITMLRGLKYPDEYMIKFFFKQKLHEKKGNVIEFGCSNGNNLSLFYQYGYSTAGVDYSLKNIQNANYNFSNIYESNANFSFFSENMLDYIQKKDTIKYDVFMIPNVISYLTKKEFISFLQTAKSNKIFTQGADFFLRTRTIRDYRFGLGTEVAPNSFQMTDNITGEANAICTCYEEHELLDLLKTHLNIKDFFIFYLDNQNYQSGRTILNADVVIWGKIS
jgi:SAM-dependent methyltransferase